jgi:hypothetical protein
MSFEDVCEVMSQKDVSIEDTSEEEQYSTQLLCNNQTVSQVCREWLYESVAQDEKLNVCVL